MTIVICNFHTVSDPMVIFFTVTRRIKLWTLKSVITYFPTDKGQHKFNHGLPILESLIQLQRVPACLFHSPPPQNRPPDQVRYNSHEPNPEHHYLEHSPRPLFSTDNFECRNSERRNQLNAIPIELGISTKIDSYTAILYFGQGPRPIWLDRWIVNFKPRQTENHVMRYKHCHMNQ